MQTNVNVLINNSYDLISAFELDNNKYLLLSNNEVTDDGLVKINCCKTLNNNIITINDEEEWNKIKDQIKILSTSSLEDNTKYFFVSNDSNFEAELDFYKTIAVKKEALDMIVKKFNDKVSEQSVENDVDDIPIPVLDNSQIVDTNNIVENPAQEEIVETNNLDELHEVIKQSVEYFVSKIN